MSEEEHQINGDETGETENGGVIDISRPPAPRDIANQFNEGTPDQNGSAIPPWKQAMIVKKRKEELARQEEEQQKLQQEEDRWKDVPAWKRKLLMDKEKKKAEEEAQQREARKGQLELEAKIAEMPEWKRQIYMKKVYLDKPLAGENEN